MRLGDIIPPGYNQAYAILQYHTDSPNMAVEDSGGSVSSLESEVNRLRQEGEKRDRQFEELRQEGEKRDKQFEELRQEILAAVQTERELREQADAKLQALLESEIVERQMQNCVVANAIVHQVGLDNFLFYFYI